jgi:hypothetical protein
MFYPRNFNLSQKFVNAFKEEVNRLKTEGASEKDIIKKRCSYILCIGD